MADKMQPTFCPDEDDCCGCQIDSLCHLVCALKDCRCCKCKDAIVMAIRCVTDAIDAGGCCPIGYQAKK